MNYCYACGKQLTNPESIRFGIGPICRAKRQREKDEQEEITKCHFGFNCQYPEHIRVVLQRLWTSVENWQTWLIREYDLDGTEVDPALLHNFKKDISCNFVTISDALGLERKRVDIPDNIGKYIDLLNKQSHRAAFLREIHICPSGLDCQDPHGAVAAVYRILNIIRFNVDPLFRKTRYGGIAVADERAFRHLANILQIMGLNDEADYIIRVDMPYMKKIAKQFEIQWEKHIQNKMQKRLFEIHSVKERG